MEFKSPKSGLKAERGLVVGTVARSCSRRAEIDGGSKRISGKVVWPLSGDVDLRVEE